MAKNVFVHKTPPSVPSETPIIPRETGKKKVELATNHKWRYLTGISFLFLAFFLFVCFCSYVFVWCKDYDKISLLSPSKVFSEAFILSNVLGRMGGYIAFLFIQKGFGISSFLFISYSLFIGFRLLKLRSRPLLKNFYYHSFFLVWISLLLGIIFRHTYLSFLGGAFGYELGGYLRDLTGETGVYLILLFSLVCFTLFAYNFQWKWYPSFLQKKDIKSDEKSKENSIEEIKQTVPFLESPIEQGKTSEIEFKENDSTTISAMMLGDKPPAKSNPMPKAREIEEKKDDIPFTVETLSEQISNDTDSSENQENKLTHSGLDSPYDPRLDLRDYQFPTLDLLVDFGNTSKQTTVQNEELLANKNRIIDTLKNYAIEISQIKATIGPTVTLYEIVPAPGVRISKIKNLEDDIALSLSALGIRIIAPIPGKGTIGIEVPNINKQIVSMREMLISDKFKNGNFDLPIALGKTISNECFVTDLAKMPHLLMAGATGQGKSVGLNAIIGSLLYKKHPSELKFVMVDPKKVELSLFNKIERHYLAKLPDAAESIITDTRKVVRTLNSLCIEMDQRYDLLKDAQVKNIKEYNTKFIARRLNPNEGHRYLPYIVLIIDEFADLIMTAGKEIELPIARLAQLARAIGIHLVIATQRPSVNIITGIIKANFPARIAFRVTSKIDSRTILDAGGADQLVGRGDMLLSTGNEMLRIQCAFIDTPEIEKITEFIGGQRAYPTAYNLPECPEDSNDSGNKDFSLDERDSLFEEAARLIVATQQGSTSLIQRKLKLGYNRAGRLIDQLESAGIVGPFEGSKSREVKIKDPIALDQILNNTENELL